MPIKTHTEEITSFNQLYKDYQKRFVCFANFYVRDWNAAENIVTEAIVYYWENRHAISSEKSNIPAYILTVIKNKSLNYLRHLRICEDHLENVRKYNEWELNMRITSLEACDPYELFAGEIKELIRQTLDALPERTRKIFVLNRYENKSYKEIAALLGITLKGVGFHMGKALKAFQINLKDYFPLFLLFF